MNQGALPCWIDASWRGDITPLHGIPRYIDSDGIVRPRWSRTVERSHRVYFVTGGRGLVKIGFSTDVPRRIRELQTASPTQLTVIAQIVGTRRIEALIHDLFSKHHVSGEWYAIDAESIAIARAHLIEKGLLA